MRVLVVPGNLPIGCSAAYLTVYESQRMEDYDPRTGCINYLNDFATYHNRLLQKELHRLRDLHPRATIIYADYYNAAMRFYRSPLQFGFGSGALAACCGGGGPYNYNASATCGGQHGWTVCDEPSSHVAWDGVHLTEAAYRSIAHALIRESFFKPSITAACKSSSKTREQRLYSDSDVACDRTKTANLGCMQLGHREPSDRVTRSPVLDIPPADDSQVDSDWNRTGSHGDYMNIGFPLLARSTNHLRPPNEGTGREDKQC
ncbi:hypothetical protein ACLOJK_010479 [Asimina triloba]